MFNYQDGFVHFVFAEDKRYCLPSLAHVSLPYYLYYLMKESGVQSVWMVSGQGPYEVTSFGHLAAAQVTDALNSTGWLKKLFQAPVDQPLAQSPVLVQSMPAAQAEKMIAGLLSRCSGGALVLHLDTLAALSREPGSQLVSQLIRCQELGKAKKNILVLQGSVSASDNADYLLDPQGPFFFSKDGKYLCPALSSILMKLDPVPLYSCLSKAMPDRVTLLNDLRPQRIQYILRSVMLQNPDRILSQADTEQLAFFLYTWLGCAALRSRFPGLLKARDGRLRMDLELQLSDIRTWNAVLSCFSALEQEGQGRNPMDQLRSAYPVASDELSAYITVQDPISNSLCSMEPPEELPEQAKKDLLEIRQYFCTQWSQKRPQFVNDAMGDIISLLQWSLDNRETDYFAACAASIRQHALEASVQPRRKLEEIYSKLLELMNVRKTALQLRRNIPVLKEKRLATLRHTQALQEELARSESKVMDIRTVQLKDAKDACIVLKKNIARHEMTLQQYAKISSILENMLSNLRLDSHAIPEYSAQELLRSLQDCDDTISRLALSTDLSELKLEQEDDSSLQTQEQTAREIQAAEQELQEIQFTEAQTSAALYYMKKQNYLL